MTDCTQDDSVPREHGIRAETSFRAVLLGLLLSVIMLGANMYLGLRVGMTVSASIPAAVISMAILRGILRRGTVLENNIVQTMASTGESLAAGAIFTVPALVLAGAWETFSFWPTTLIALLGGVLGIICMVPLRRALIVRRTDLAYPEGVACAHVLRAGEEGGARKIGLGLLCGGLIKGLSGALGLFLGTVEGAAALGRSVFCVGIDISPALLGVGYIVRLPIALLVLIGGAISWLVAIPLLGGLDDTGDIAGHAWDIWKTQARYLGVGAMLVGGLHAIWQVRHGLVEGLRALRRAGGRRGEAVPDTDRDMSFAALVWIFLSVLVGIAALYMFLVGDVVVALLATLVMALAAFLLVAVATYIVGLVGSSNSPVSGMTICALLLAAGVLWLAGAGGPKAVLSVLGVAGVVCCAVSTAGDIAQDLKTGSLVGATPARQQWMELLAVIVPALFVAPVLLLLHEAYQIGSENLLAPQAQLFASLAGGLFGQGTVPWDLVLIGALIGLGLIIADAILARCDARVRLYVMPVAVGLYLPFSLGVAMVLGGLIRHFAERRAGPEADEARDPGVLFGSGLIAGEALTGIALAVPLVVGVQLPNLGGGRLLSLVVMAALCVVFWRATRPDARK